MLFQYNCGACCHLLQCFGSAMGEKWKRDMEKGSWQATLTMLNYSLQLKCRVRKGIRNIWKGPSLSFLMHQKQKGWLDESSSQCGFIILGGFFLITACLLLICEIGLKIHTTLTLEAY